MSWAADRVTTRVEDLAYCLLGVFDVNIPSIYGEGQKAFLCLQEEIIKSSNDQSIFAWQDCRPYPAMQRLVQQSGNHLESGPKSETGLLATWPYQFRESANVITIRDPALTAEPFIMTNMGLSIELALRAASSGRDQDRDRIFFATIDCLVDDLKMGRSRVQLTLKTVWPTETQFVRLHDPGNPQQLVNAWHQFGKMPLTRIFVRQSSIARRDEIISTLKLRVNSHHEDDCLWDFLLGRRIKLLSSIQYSSMSDTAVPMRHGGTKAPFSQIFELQWAQGALELALLVQHAKSKQRMVVLIARSARSQFSAELQCHPEQKFESLSLSWSELLASGIDDPMLPWLLKSEYLKLVADGGCKTSMDGYTCTLQVPDVEHANGIKTADLELCIEYDEQK